ncbi:hypothetical protein PIB30_096883 [Stylosanthes scabra]|uniref:Uncharacterized protein n=1 Tax=Stylosanthes scabra TaxID=79078 RepID=A0ABU6UV00_9FABA|nr:hypothetical protein [Stylosanthes scabra]
MVVEDLHIHNMHHRIHWIDMRCIEEYDVGRVEDSMESILHRTNNKKQTHIFISRQRCHLTCAPVAALAADSEFLKLKARFHCRGIQTSYENDNRVVNRKVTQGATS